MDRETARKDRVTTEGIWDTVLLKISDKCTVLVSGLSHLRTQKEGLSFLCFSVGV